GHIPRDADGAGRGLLRGSRRPWLLQGRQARLPKASWRHAPAAQLRRPGPRACTPEPTARCPSRWSHDPRFPAGRGAGERRRDDAASVPPPCPPRRSGAERPTPAPRVARDPRCILARGEGLDEARFALITWFVGVRKDD